MWSQLQPQPGNLGASSNFPSDPKWLRWHLDLADHEKAMAGNYMGNL
jgi:hypothetical protein